MCPCLGVGKVCCGRCWRRTGTRRRVLERKRDGKVVHQADAVTGFRGQESEGLEVERDGEVTQIVLEVMRGERWGSISMMLVF